MLAKTYETLFVEAHISEHVFFFVPNWPGTATRRDAQGSNCLAVELRTLLAT